MLAVPPRSREARWGGFRSVTSGCSAKSCAVRIALARRPRITLRHRFSASEARGTATVGGQASAAHRNLTVRGLAELLGRVGLHLLLELRLQLLQVERRTLLHGREFEEG